MKQVLAPDHIPVNKYQLIVVPGPPKINFITIAGLEEELEVVDLPDRTKASGGNTKAIEFTATHSIHELPGDIYLEAWFKEAEFATPTYKRGGTLLVTSISGLVTRSFNMIGLFPGKRKTADLEMANEGELNVKEWTFFCDRMIPV